MAKVRAGVIREQVAAWVGEINPGVGTVLPACSPPTRPASNSWPPPDPLLLNPFSHN
jgi:hypothetical protein